MSIQPQLKRFDLTMIVVSLVIGVGIFRTPAMVASSAGKEWVFYAAWITGGIISICGALTFAEIGARLPAAGAYYRIFSSAYHPAYAFMLNWSQVIINAGSSAGVAIIGAEYITPVLFPDVSDATNTIRIIALIIILLLFGINLLGIKMGARTQNILSILKIGMILTFCMAIFGSHAEPVSVHVPENWNFMHAFGIALISIFFTYGGYQQTMNFGGDVPNASRTLPRGIFFGIAIILTLYLLANLSYYLVLGFNGLQQSSALASDVAGALLGDYASRTVAVIMFFAVMAYVNASIMSNPRVYYAMAEDKVLPAIFKRINERTQVQEFAVTVFVAFMIITLFLSSSFSKVLDYVMFFDSIALASAAAAIFVLRHRAKRNGEPSGIYKIPLYPWLPLVYIVTYCFVNTSLLVSNREAALMGFLLFVSGLPLYWLLKKLVDRPVG